MTDLEYGLSRIYGKFKGTKMWKIYAICKNIKSTQSEIFVIIFNGRNKFLYRFHFVDSINKSMKLYKNPDPEIYPLSHIYRQILTE